MTNPLTISSIARRFGVTVRQLDYAIRAHEVSSGRAGLTRVWSDEDLPTIEAALRSTGALPAKAGAGR